VQPCSDKLAKTSQRRVCKYINMFRGGYRFCGSEAHTSFGALFIKKNYECKIRYKSEYLCRACPRALEGAHASEEPLSLILISFAVNPPLNVLY